jgi:hypothetical protein
MLILSYGVAVPHLAQYLVLNLDWQRCGGCLHRTNKTVVMPSHMQRNSTVRYGWHDYVLWWHSNNRLVCDGKTNLYVIYTRIVVLHNVKFRH